MSFERRIIELTFTKGVGTFAESKTDRLTVSGLRVQCNIINVGGIQMGQAQLRIYGLTLSQMNDLSALNGGFMVQRKIGLQIKAGVANAMNLVFDGQITLGRIDLNSVPDSTLVVVAQAGILQALQVATPTSYPAGTDHLTVMKNLATQMGLSFEGNGTPIPLSKPYYPGTLRDQAMRCADAAGVNWTIINGTLIVWPRYGVRASGANGVPVVSPDTGMVGYPSYSDIGIAITTLFNPFIRLGQLVTVKSSLPFANGSWGAFYIHHELESEIPGAKWFTHFDGQPYVQ